jgi:SAM-dependent methyltransferase
MPERYVFLGMPGYGNQTAGAGRSFYHACRDSTDGRRCPSNEFRDKVIKQQKIGSLLACNMNSLWAQAKTLVHRGNRIDYFAMLHDDIGCEDWWLDKLIDELEASDLDILSVVSPIKDCRGLTSTAIAAPDGDPWSVTRLTMDEVYRLPPTFTSEDIGGELLLNTGCWVCRFGVLGEYPFYFTINDEITFSEQHDCYVADVESEDWFFSRLCHKAGLKVGATRKISIFHEGATRYLNSQPWGRDRFDSAAVDKSPIPERKDGFKFPNEVEGWLAFVEGEQLFNIAKGKRVLEIGSFKGRSTICLAQSALEVVSVDPHDGQSTLTVKVDTYSDCIRNVDRYELDNVEFVRGTIEDVTDGNFDLIFIDGDHRYDAVTNDIQHALRLLAPDGLIAFHDYRSEREPGVTRAVDKLIAEGGELLSIHGTLAVVKTPAAIPLEV